MTRPLILIVDDEPQIQRFLGHALTAAGSRLTRGVQGAPIDTRSGFLIGAGKGIP